MEIESRELTSMLQFSSGAGNTQLAPAALNDGLRKIITCTPKLIWCVWGQCPRRGKSWLTEKVTFFTQKTPLNLSLANFRVSRERRWWENSLFERNFPQLERVGEDEISSGQPWHGTQQHTHGIYCKLFLFRFVSHVLRRSRWSEISSSHPLSWALFWKVQGSYFLAAGSLASAKLQLSELTFHLRLLRALLLF